jgi:hypothetical protein
MSAGLPLTPSLKASCALTSISLGLRRRNGDRRTYLGSAAFQVSTVDTMGGSPEPAAG